MKNYNTIVIAGGGMKGFAILGVLQYLYQSKLLKNIKKYIGTSVGALLSVLMVLEYQPIEISLHLSRSPEFKKFIVCNIYNGIHGKGVINYDYFETILNLSLFLLFYFFLNFYMLQAIFFHKRKFYQYHFYLLI